MMAGGALVASEAIVVANKCRGGWRKFGLLIAWLKSGREDIWTGESAVGKDRCLKNNCVLGSWVRGLVWWVGGSVEEGDCRCRREAREASERRGGERGRAKEARRDRREEIR